MKKIKHIAKAVASGIIWGSGQLFNKQFLKAGFFFLFFALLLGIELGTGNIIKGYDPYQEQLTGEDYSSNFARNFVTAYNDDVNSKRIQKNEDFEAFYQLHKADGFTNDELIDFIAQDILKGSRIKYYTINGYIKAKDKNADNALTDLYPDTNVNEIANLKKYENARTTYRSSDGKEYYIKQVGTGSTARNTFINVNDESDILEREAVQGYTELFRDNEIYYDRSTMTNFYLAVKISKGTSKDIYYYENVMNPNEKIFPDDFNKTDYVVLSPKINVIYYSDTTVYGYYNPQTEKYKETSFTKYLSEEINSQLYGIGSKYDQTDLARFKLKVYFAMYPDVKEEFETRFNNFFYNRAGFFLQGFWGIITLGTTDSANYYQISLLDNCIKIDSGTPISTMVVRGHLSSYILLRSLISTLLLCYFLVVYIWNIRDAYKTSVQYEQNHKHVKDTIYFKKMYESSFEYIVLLPAIFTITFISVMPIIFSFLIAFTSYSGNASDVGLFDWVGLKNFTSIFVFGGDIPFGQVFWKVFFWTAIWAVFSTLTVFFGGFFQALVINAERVPLKKFWRTLLILPWAIPAIITQMVFANIFNEYGVVNAFMENIGLYDIFKNWGILGVKYAEITNGLQRAFYLGEDNIQWFTNPYNKWFVRIVLIVVNIWIGFPYYMALMTGVMTGIDETLYEAAEMDGGNKWQKLKYITFPLVMYSTAPLLVMCFSGNFNNFGMIYFVTQGGAHAGDFNTAYAGDTDILISWMYRLTVDEKVYNMASVFSILIFFIVGSIAAWNYSRTKAFKED